MQMARSNTCIRFIVWISLLIVLCNQVIADVAANWRDTTFRVNKLNFIWSKALTRISDKTLLERLKTELGKYEGLYLSAKSDDYKKGQDLTHMVDVKLEQLLSKYDLSEAVTAYNKKHKWRNEDQMRLQNSVLPSEKFSDPKLQKLWRAALNSRFTESQLKGFISFCRTSFTKDQSLHKELKDHERTMELYGQKLSQFNEVNGNDLDEESVHAADKLNRELKEHFNTLQQSYDMLHQKILQTPSNTFVNEKVENLWRLANRNGNFTASELESIHLELTHFDRQMKKLEMHQSELEAAERRQEQLGKVNVANDEIDAFKQENMRLTRKMRKLEHEITSKLAHTEL